MNKQCISESVMRTLTAFAGGGLSVALLEAAADATEACVGNGICNWPVRGAKTEMNKQCIVESMMLTFSICSAGEGALSDVASDDVASATAVSTTVARLEGFFFFPRRERVERAGLSVAAGTVLRRGGIAVIVN